MGDRIPAARYADRLARARAGVGSAGAAALLVGVGPELEWLTGYAAVGGERLNLLVITADGDPVYVSPRLEAPAAAAAPGITHGSVPIVTWEETDDPYALVAALLPPAATGPCLISDGARAAFVLGLQGARPDAEWALASVVLAPLRRVKDEDEVALLRAAASAADRAMERIVSGPLVGRTEAEVARDVREALVAEGHDSAEFAIVASGPNSASPHHEPGARVIAHGEPLLLDIGGRLAGYHSDITRTIWIDDPSGRGPHPDFAAIYELTAAGQSAARAAVRPGITFEALDAVARDAISAGGFGDRFIHRLGHGIGLEVHEAPYVVAGNRDVAIVGDTFSCEPGIYLEGRFGVRIEDVVRCTAEGGESLNHSPRALRVVAGR